MKRHLLYLSFLLLNNYSFGQSTFQTTYGDAEIDFGDAITAATGNGYCVVSTNKNIIGVENADVVLYYIDDDGGLLWSAKIGTDKNDYATDIIQTADGGFAITGYTYGGLIDSTTTDVFLLKTDDQGFPVYFQTFGGPSDDEGAKILNTPDGGFYIAGSTKSFGNGLQSALLIRTDNNGNQVWTNVNSATDINAYKTACYNLNGQIIAAGNTLDFSTNNRENYISLIDTTGNLIWSKKFGSNGSEYLNQILLLNDGNIISVGSSDNQSAGNFDFNICKLDSSGTLLWNKNYGRSEYDEAKSVALCANGDLVIGGTTNISSSSSPVLQNAMLRIDSNGNLLWSNSYGDPSGNSEGVRVIEGFNNALISVGYLKSINDVFGETYFVKSDANGVSGCYQSPLVLQTQNNVFTDSTGADQQSVFMTDFQLLPNWQSFSNQFSLYCFNNSISDSELLSTLSVFPNPNTGLFTIQTNNSGKHFLEIYNSFGQKVMNKTFGEEFVKLDMSNYLPGIYYFKVNGTQNGKIVLTGN